MISFKQYITEGILDIFHGKKKVAENQPLTDEQRSHITKHFPHSNANLRFTPGGRHVLSHNAHVTHGSLRVAFRNEGGKLMASVAHHNSSNDATDPKITPITHSDHDAQTDDHMQHIKSLSK